VFGGDYWSITIFKKCGCLFGSMIERLAVKYHLWRSDVADDNCDFAIERFHLSEAHRIVSVLEKSAGETDWSKGMMKRIKFQYDYGCGQ